MVYKGKKTWKDLVEKSDHVGLTRRDLIARGMATGFLSLTAPTFMGRSFLREAHAATLNCPPSTQALGALAQIYSEGGPTMGARFIAEDQAAIMNETVARNYGITGTNLLKLGPNLVIDTTSAFGATLMQGPPGFAGGAAGWQATVLNKLSAGGHRGPFNADDGAGSNTGLLGGASPYKASQLGKDLRVGVSHTMAGWAAGLPSTSISGGNNLNAAALARTFSMTPAATGLVTSQSMTDASNAAIDLAAALAETFGHSARNGAATLSTATGCSVLGNSSVADPNFGNSLFTATGISQLTGSLTVGTLTAAEQALLAAYYQSAVGKIGGVIYELRGRDYHGQNPQTVIAPADVEEARAIVMFLAACHAAQSRGAFLYFSNGQAIADGVQAATVTVDGAALNVNAPVARGDAGGSYNAGLILFYDPAGAPPAATFTGTIASNSGNAKTGSTIGSSKTAVAGLYLSAYSWLNGGTVPQAAISAMGVTSAASIMVI